jgi:hypothetical protein
MVYNTIKNYIFIEWSFLTERIYTLFELSLLFYNKVMSRQRQVLFQFISINFNSFFEVLKHAAFKMNRNELI